MNFASIFITDQLNSTEQAFGNEAGALLYDEAYREDIFQNTNCIDGVKMEPLDSDQFTGELRSAARKNAMAIKSNIQKLVRIFARRDMRDKLVKEFGVFKNNEIANFRGAYDKMKQLYQVKNGTSLEEYLTT